MTASVLSLILYVALLLNHYVRIIPLIAFLKCQEARRPVATCNGTWAPCA